MNKVRLLKKLSRNSLIRLSEEEKSFISHAINWKDESIQAFLAIRTAAILNRGSEVIAFCNRAIFKAKENK